MRSMLIHRWETSIGDISVLCSALRDVLPDIPAKSRGRPPKHPLKDYLLLLVVKESKRSSLRSAETDWSQLVCGERIDHSVLAYWEQRIPRDALQRAVRMLGARLQALLGYLFSMIDATAFATWHHRTVSFHVLNGSATEPCIRSASPRTVTTRYPTCKARWCLARVSSWPTAGMT